MKYRLLTDEELQLFEEDFTHFLIVNGVHGEEWEKMNSDDPDKAIALVEMFSDTVLQKVYEKIRFIEFRSKNSCMVFRLDPENIQLISVNVKPDAQADLSTPESIHEALVKTPEQLTLFKTGKNYSGEREAEIHRMIEQGCVHSSEEFWNALSEVLK